MRGIKLCLMLGILAIATAGLMALNAAEKPRDLKPGLYAVIDTGMGKILCELYEKKAPHAVANFVGLAQGTKEWLSPKGEMVKRPYYNGVIFHRVIKNFMIQAGDVTGTGTFKPILPFGDEIAAGLRFDRPGVLAMANSGPNTNGTQFFITVTPTPHLNGKHTIFGEVVEGFDVAVKISKVSVGAAYRPLENVTINKIIIERRGTTR